MDIMDKLTILTDGAKYDAACTSSGVTRKGPANGKGLGNVMPAGCCHSFSSDGRCITLLKVLMSNSCIYDCKYCVNRSSNDVPRATFTPSELADLTIQFYRRNYIEGLFLSSGVIKNPDYTSEQMAKALEVLRYQYGFWGYIHTKILPGTSAELVRRLGLLADRVSVNVELPSEASLVSLAPQKKREAIFTPMAQITQGITTGKAEVVQYRKAPKFAPGGQATQMIIGASPESDYSIVRLASALYGKYDLKRVFYSAYIPAIRDKMLPAIDTKPPLLREHRLYQADWLMREYHFEAEEILSDEEPNFNPYMDPKCNWAVNNLHFFPVDVGKADYEALLRVPGIGPKSAARIVTARRHSRLGMAELKRIGVVLKRAKYFIVTSDEPLGISVNKYTAAKALIDPNSFSMGVEQLTLFDAPQTRFLLDPANHVIEDVREEAALCLATKL
ncbi:MAG: putative DNA modification/repair radical SAM protein [Defluviitaleaceae bacterium]|nr:putative DNA modification/repair radical SAM protein [Defluviitaleaceae bacterium]